MVARRAGQLGYCAAGGAKSTYNRASTRRLGRYWRACAYRPLCRGGAAVKVPQLVDGACLPQYSPLMGVGEKAHQRSRQGDSSGCNASHPLVSMYDGHAVWAMLRESPNVARPRAR